MIRVIEKSINILELLASDSGREFPLGEIADTIGLNHGTCTNIIKTLAARGYVQQSAPRCGYKLGYMIYKLTNTAVRNDELVKISKNDIDQLGRDLNETAILSAIKNDKRIILHHTVPNRELIVTSNIAKSVYSTNTGRVILANYTPPHLEKFVIRCGLPSKADWPEIYSSDNERGEFMNRLAAIKTSGYEIYRNERTGILGVAAPLFRRDHVVGSVGVFLPISRLDDEAVILSKVMQTADSINSKLSLTDSINQLP